jgi:small subunit ribosomal protein S5
MLKKPLKEKPKEEFESKLLDLSRVAHTRAGGRRIGFRAAILVGDKKGRVGFGVSRGKDVALAVEKATRVAKKRLITIPIVNNTIPHEVYAKFGAAEILLKPQKGGRGLVTGGIVRVICNLGGIKNISSKILGRTGNKLNNARAAITAFKKLKHAITRTKTNS